METREDLENNKVPAPIFGHVADGNFHCILIYNEELDGGKEYLDKLQLINNNLIKRSLSVGGTISGEHGVGYGKRNWLVEELGDNVLEQMKLIKKMVYDPKGILNVGKVF